MFYERAKAKINLTLKVLGKRLDGYHELESFVAFADIADRLTYAPEEPYGISVNGSYGTAIVGENLIHKAALAFRDQVLDVRLGAFNLEKNLPIASGIGGGSANAAAALRLLCQAHNISTREHPSIYAIAQKIGADVPVCLNQTPAFMTGIGERLHVISEMPLLHCILVNPNCAVPTSEVFRRLNAEVLKPEVHAKKNRPNLEFKNHEDILVYMRKNDNDLEQASISYQPIIADVLSALKNQTQSQIARMSGSGATCFAVYASEAHAKEATNIIELNYPEWWCVQTVLGNA
ncbi:MAG: 4-(cytidine 5'-diphospho)-2-C-methyl-D-erythritol kinase [Pseudomonadota bacterium]